MGGRVICLFQNGMGGFSLIGQFCQFDLTIIQQVKINKMWYLKKTAESVWNASKNLVDKRTPVQKLIDSIAQSQQQILPTNKLSELSTLTYEVDAFDEIVTLLFEKLKKFHYDLPESQKTLNILVATNYIIKHGATGFVDEFRKYVYMFKKYEQLEPKRTYEDLITQSQLDANLQKIKSRAHHISELLSNKQKLLKQKQLSMLVKQKLKLYEKSKLSTLRNEQYSNDKQRQENKQQKKTGESDNSNLQSTFKNIGSKTQQLFKHPEDLSIKLEGLLQTYVWKYVDKLDETIESASDKVMQQIDKYVLGEHDKFQMEDEEKEQQSLNSNKKLRKQEKPREVQEEVEDDDELMKRLEEEAHQIKQVEHADLLEFEQVKPREQEKPKPIEDLL